MAVHPERLAWDGARALVRAVESDDMYGWLVEEVDVLLGPAHRQALSDSYPRLVYDRRADAVHREAGMWRARLVDLLHADPALAAPVGTLIERVSRRLP